MHSFTHRPELLLLYRSSVRSTAQRLTLFEGLKGQFPWGATYVTADVEELPQLAVAFAVYQESVLLAFQQGKEYWRRVGDFTLKEVSQAFGWADVLSQ